jgi:triacylglycerol lipase
MRFYALLLILLLNINFAHAQQVLVLVHGYHGDGSGWRITGIVAHLQQVGWQDGGHLFPYHATLPPPGEQSARYLYTISLPSEAPLPVQSDWLDRFLHIIQQRHLEAEFILVGHSLGGVVARLSMVKARFPIIGLVTIASPHLGTDKAEIGRWIADSPLSLITPFIGLGNVNRSRNLFLDLEREYPASPLFNLNRTPHPEAVYISVVRVEEDSFWTAMVPNYSQDMNNIPALRGKAITIRSLGSHYLQPADAPSLASLLTRYFPN